MRALIIADNLCQDAEFIYPYYRLQEAGYNVEVASPNGGELVGIGGVKLSASIPITHAIEAECVDGQPPPDLLVIPGGVKAMEKLRLHEKTVEYVRHHYKRERPIASICSGAQLLITAGVVRGHGIAAYPAMSVDVENAGAKFVDQPAVMSRVGRNIIMTSPHYRSLGAWMGMVVRQMGGERVTDA